MFQIEVREDTIAFLQDEVVVFVESFDPDGSLEDAYVVVDDVIQRLTIATREVVRLAWRARVLDRTDGFHR
jgi:hypothetical protein